ncbi:MAG: response regulator [SAR324 cluster bacterium]|nr:response regulator [SAR324 cluster bacterium]
MNKKVLIVEDDKVNQIVLSKHLSNNFELDSDIAVDGLEAIDKFKESAGSTSPYLIVFMDIIMPNMNGFDSTKAIRVYEREQGLKRTPIILVSGNLIEDSLVQATSCGSDYLIPKPIALSQLKEVVERFA